MEKIKNSIILTIFSFVLIFTPSIYTVEYTAKLIKYSGEVDTHPETAIINNHGEVAFQYSSAFFPSIHVWKPGSDEIQFVYDKTTRGRGMKLTGFNDLGQVTGLGYLYKDLLRDEILIGKRYIPLLFIWDSNTKQFQISEYDLERQPAVGISNDGIAVGNYRTNSKEHYIWNGTDFSESGKRVIAISPGGKILTREKGKKIAEAMNEVSSEFVFGRMVAINDNSNIIGFALYPDSGLRHAFIYKDDKFVFLRGFKGVQESYPLGLNNHDQVVGTYIDEKGNSRAALWDDARLSDLNDMVKYPDSDNRSGKVILTHAFGINDEGQIVAKGTITKTRLGHKEKEEALFVLTPDSDNSSNQMPTP